MGFHEWLISRLNSFGYMLRLASVVIVDYTGTRPGSLGSQDLWHYTTLKEPCPLKETDQSG